MRYRLVMLLLVSVALIAAASPALAYQEAPMLAEKVEAGELPPVEERLPKNPMVIEPWHEIGQYGGTWYRQSGASDWSHMRMKMYGHSPVRLIDDGLDVAPNWVERWETSDDFSIWTFHIREGIRWSDGEPFTSADFMFWWDDMVLNEEHSDPVPDMLAVGGQPAEMSAPDDYTIVMEFTEPTPLLVYLLATGPNAGIYARLIVPKHYLIDFHPDYSDEYDDMEVLEEKQEWWINVETPVLTEWMPVQHDVGDRLVLERNPFFYAVDSEGNQLPYIDRVNNEYMEDSEVILLRWMEGQADMQLRPYAELSDFSMLIDNQEHGDYRVVFWDSGSGTGPMLYWNWNHPDDQKRELYRMPEFRQALSHAINREQIRDMAWFGLGDLTTGTFSPKSGEFHRTEEGQQLFQEWNTAYLYDVERAEQLLDEIGVVDQNGDGWRQYPNGDELRLRIDFNAETGTIDIQTNEMVQSDWQDIGIRTELNPMDGSALNVLTQTAEFDIHNSWEVGNGPNFWIPPHWIVPHDLSRWAPLYGSWYQQEQAGTAHDEDDRDPRDRTPPRERPADDDPVRKLQNLYDQARVEEDETVRDQLAMELVRIHIDDGPFFIGTVQDYPRAVVVRNHFHNVPEPEDLTLGGFVNPWQVVYPAMTNPAQYWMSEQ